MILLDPLDRFFDIVYVSSVFFDFSIDLVNKGSLFGSGFLRDLAHVFLKVHYKGNRRLVRGGRGLAFFLGHGRAIISPRRSWGASRLVLLLSCPLQVLFCLSLAIDHGAFHLF